MTELDRLVKIIRDQAELINILAKRTAELDSRVRALEPKPRSLQEAKKAGKKGLSAEQWDDYRVYIDLKQQIDSIFRGKAK